MRAEQRDHLQSLTTTDARRGDEHSSQIGSWPTEQSGNYEAGADHSPVGFAEQRADAATTTPGWETRPASEFTHFGSGSLRSRSNAWLSETLDRFLTSLASINPGPLLIAGAVIVAFGLGWTGGSIFDSNPSATPLVQKGDASDATAPPLAESDTRPAASASNPREISAGADRPQKTVTPHVRQRISSPAAPQVARADYNPAPQLSAVPETKPVSIEGWSVRNVNGDRAVLVGPDRVWTVKRGDTVPGVGRINTIVRWGNRWIVATSSGLISTD